MAKHRFGRSDIPYKDRLLMQKYQNIADHRNEAALVALSLACVALNNTEGLGLVRLTRFAKELQGLIDEFYADPEVGAVHLQKRLEQIGFVIRDGRLFVLEGMEGKVISGEKFREETK